MCSFHSRAATIQEWYLLLIGIGEIFCKRKGFEKNKFYKINICVNMKQTFTSRRFSAEQYLHGTSHPTQPVSLPLMPRLRSQTPLTTVKTTTS